MKTVKLETGWFLVDQYQQRGPFPTRDAARNVLRMLKLEHCAELKEERSDETQ